MSYEVEWSRIAIKELLSIEIKQRLMILKWVDDNLTSRENPKAIPGSKALKGTKNGWRYRVGSYRILATINEGKLLIEVVRVGHRQGVYKNLPKEI
ncbi:plasmid stabilization protein [Tractidigestivibacter scatoligenes]|jgi:mRNA interferase RelE/StbE|uniref:Plasmid stabilization protein n=1 Tax=Tractidigestivibacter scatoligenes TaxID=1299998 RepID=A0A100YW46_TRASO|nr:type II toxin-antitoxin system RelE/ParE family toxin [Tractidigestivibacter scatoligenes]KUH58801.1 plasmid stabilization protein [Tractidigestivibacter scatoligenes]